MDNDRRALIRLIKQDLLLSAPTLAAAIVLVAVLSLNKKHSTVEILDAHTGFLSFETLASHENDRPGSLIDVAVSAVSINITNAGPISLTGATLTGPSGNISVTGTATRPLRIIPAERTRAARLSWQATGADLVHLTSLTAPPGALVTLDAADGVLTLNIQSSRIGDHPPSLTFSLPDTVQLTIERSAVVQHDGRVVFDVRERGQLGLSAQLTQPSQIVFLSAARNALGLQLILANSGEPTELIRRATARRINFVRPFYSGPDLEGESALKSATLYLRDSPSNEKLEIARNGFFADPDSFLIDYIDVHSDELTLGASSLTALRSLRIGRTHDSSREQLTSVLEWLFQDNLITISVMLMLWFLAKGFAIRHSYTKRLAHPN